MSNINSVTITGNLTRDPETREIGNGSVTSLRVAVNDRRKVGEEWQDVANYFDVSVFGGLGENCARFLERGRGVAIAGKLRWREWETDDGKRQAVSIIANEVQFLSSGSGSSQTDDGGDEPF